MTVIEQINVMVKNAGKSFGAPGMSFEDAKRYAESVRRVYGESWRYPRTDKDRVIYRFMINLENELAKKERSDAYAEQQSREYALEKQRESEARAAKQKQKDKEEAARRQAENVRRAKELSWFQAAVAKPKSVSQPAQQPTVNTADKTRETDRMLADYARNTGNSIVHGGKTIASPGTGILSWKRR